ncbi:MAG TPA: alpha/beta hydrolase domain-containing protein [Vicinamibacterales bacterium]|nr:alpha/beta hydrolase domain-containing protein [Vicinamibacterales bacterium]
MSGTVTAVALLAPMALVVVLWRPGVEPGQGQEQASEGVSACDQFLPPPRRVEGREVGPQSCLSRETALTLGGRSFVRLDIGLDGTVDGYLTKTGDYKEYLTNAPDLVFGQTADTGRRYLAVARYERNKGAAMSLVFPRETRAWNGKLWVTAHGRGRSFAQGSLKRWDRYVDPADPLRDLNKYDRLMLSKGYALAKTYRTSAEGLGEILATLDDGSTVDYAAFNDSANYIKDFAEVAVRALAARLGRGPRRMYFYGHSAGARIGRGLNYTPGLNRRRDGRPFFDGLLLDDAAAGGWLPVVIKEGRDVLFATDAEKAGFVPQIDLTHQMYNNIWPSRKAEFMSASYLANKRNNARILKAKGLGDRHRIYEVRGISHSGGESLADGRDGEIQILDLSKLMSGIIDLLDGWVDKGQAPPPSRSDWAPLGDADGDGVIEHPAIAFPEVACPLGVYYPYPTPTSGTTAFAAFTGEGLEPLDKQSVFADMNRNGVWDFRESLPEAWRRLGLLRPGETLTREVYVACVERAARALERDGFFSTGTVADYVNRARQIDLQPKVSARR